MIDQNIGTMVTPPRDHGDSVDHGAPIPDTMVSRDYRVSFTLKSANKKTGVIPVSMTEDSTCPLTCPFLKNGCYAKGGNIAMTWRRLSAHRFGLTWKQFCAAVAKLPPGQFWRHDQAGDLPGDGHEIDATALDALVHANMNKRGFTYTHYPVLDFDDASVRNIDAVRRANEQGFTVNLSGNSLRHADELAALAIAPVVVTLTRQWERGSNRKGWTETLGDYRARAIGHKTPAGRDIVVCPATYQDNVTCKTCQLCQRQRDCIVGFPAHGAGMNKAAAVAAGE